MQTIRLCNAFIKPKTPWFIFMFLKPCQSFFSPAQPLSYGIKIVKMVGVANIEHDTR